MGRKRKLTRQERALYWCLAAVLAIGLAGFQYCYLSYWGPVRDAEERGGIGKTVWLMDVPPEEYHGDGRRMLRGNEQALMAMTIRPWGFPNGWGADSRAYLDCTDERTLHAAAYRLGSTYQDGEGWKVDIEFFGRVDDPVGNRVRLELFRRSDTPTGSGWAWNLGTVEVPRLEWVKRGGIVCFERQFSISYPNSGGEMTARFTLLDWEGRELESWEHIVGWYETGEENYF